MALVFAATDSCAEPELQSPRRRLVWNLGVCCMLSTTDTQACGYMAQVTTVKTMQPEI